MYFKDEATDQDYKNVKYITILSVLDAYGQFRGYPKGEFIAVDNPYTYEGKGFNLADEGVTVTKINESSFKLEIDLANLPDEENIPVTTTSEPKEVTTTTTTTTAPIIKENPPTGIYFPSIIVLITFVSLITYYIFNKYKKFN